MLENNGNQVPQNRLLRSARILRAYFEHKLKLSLELLTEAPQDPMDSGLQFDLQLSSVGIWGLRSSAPLPQKTQSEIAASFHGLLGAMNHVDDRREELARLQDKLETSMLEAQLPSNVIPMRRALTARGRPFAAVNDKRWILRLDCLIESPHISEIHKMAFELHSQSQRYAFMEYRDLDKSCRKNLSELLQLGAVSLFVPSILDLTMAEQQVLRQLVQQDTLQRPLLMVGANMPYSNLRAEPAIHLEFLVLLSRAYIKLTRPFTEYKDKGLIHYFLDSLSQNPT